MVLAVLSACQPARPTPPLTVLAASSLTDVVADLAVAFEAQHPGRERGLIGSWKAIVVCKLASHDMGEALMSPEVRNQLKLPHMRVARGSIASARARGATPPLRSSTWKHLAARASRSI